MYDQLAELMDDVHMYSNYFAVNCINPNHNDSRPSMFVYEDADKPEGDGRFYCSGCGWSGSHKYLWSLLNGRTSKSLPSMRKEQKFLPRWAKWQDSYGSLENLVQSAHSNLMSMPVFQSYFKSRKIMEMVEPLKLGYKDGWALFPILDHAGKIIDVVCRSTVKLGNSKYVIHPDNERESPYLYVPNWKRIDSESLVYIVYGIIDAIALEMAGLPVVTGSAGKSLSYKRLINLGKKFVIIPDRNEELDARNLARDLGKFTKVLRLPYNDDEKDPDDVRRKRGIETLTNLIKGA
jgi:hypothetical protein